MSIKNSGISNISRRLYELVEDFCYGKPTVFAQKAGIPKGTFYGYLNNGIPHIDKLVRIREQFGISIDWIITGEGDKLISTSATNSSIEIPEELENFYYWSQELFHKEPGRKDWLYYELIDKIPLYAEWIKKRKTETDKKQAA